MRIEGFEAFASRFRITAIKAEQATYPPFTGGVSFRTDSVELSRIGRGLSDLQGRDDTGSIWDKRVTTNGDDKMLRAADEAIGRMGHLLEQMQDLAQLAQNPSLSEADRLSLQKEMVQKEVELEKTAARMSLEQAGISNKEIAGRLAAIEYAGESKLNMLDKALARLRNGDVLPVTYNEDGTATLAMGKMPSDTPDSTEDAIAYWMNPETNMLEETYYERIVDGTRYRTGRVDDIVELARKQLETDRKTYENWKKTAPVSLLSAEGATKAAEAIQERLEGLAKMRDELSTFAEAQRGKSVPTAPEEPEYAMDENGEPMLDAEGRRVVLPRFVQQENGSAADLRLRRPKNAIESMYSRIDAFLKDSVCKALGAYSGKPEPVPAEGREGQLLWGSASKPPQISRLMLLYDESGAFEGVKEEKIPIKKLAA